MGLILAGEIEQRGAAYHITTRALGSGDDGPPLYTLEADASGKGAILETVGALAGKVRTALGDTTVPSNGPASNETFTAASLEAAQAYVKGQELQTVPASAKRRSRSTRKRSSSIPTWAGPTRASPRSTATSAASTWPTEYYDTALSLIDRMTDREKYRTRGGYYLFKRKAPEAIKEYTALLQAFPATAPAAPTSRWRISTIATWRRPARKAARPSAIFPMNVAAATTPRSTRCTPASSRPRLPRATRC